MKLNLGSGKDIREGYDNIDLYVDDPKIIHADIEKLNEKYELNSIDEIVASDVIEHISHSKVRSVLKCWISLLKPGGKLYIKTPDIKKQAECLLNGTWNSFLFSHMVFGKQDTLGNYHKCAFKAEDLKNLLISYGMEIENISFEHHRLTSDKSTSANANVVIISKKR